MDDGTGVGIGIGMGSTLTPPFTYLLLVVIDDWWLVAEEVCNVCMYIPCFIPYGWVCPECVRTYPHISISMSPYPTLRTGNTSGQLRVLV